MQTVKLYQNIDKDRIVCEACKLKCVIRNGDVGVCGVRKNVNGKMDLLVYGKASAVNIDPIEKKPLYHFLPGSYIFSLGTVGCNFGCTFCQNWNLSQVTRDLRKRLKKEKRISDVDWEVGQYGYELMPDKIVESCIQKQIPSIAYTYNEPVIFFEYLYDTSCLAFSHGIKNVFVSNGYESVEAMNYIEPYLDAMNIDLKSFNDRFYTKICKARLQPVLDTIKEVAKRDIWLEITTLIIPGQNDTMKELRDIASFIASVNREIPWHISAFYPQYKMRDVTPTPRKTLERAYDIGKEEGLHHIYVGNIIDHSRSSTYCPKCNTALIKRNAYQTKILASFKNGYCNSCQHKIAGIWN